MSFKNSGNSGYRGDRGDRSYQANSNWRKQESEGTIDVRQGEDDGFQAVRQPKRQTQFGNNTWRGGNRKAPAKGSATGSAKAAAQDYQRGPVKKPAAIQNQQVVGVRINVTDGSSGKTLDRYVRDGIRDYDLTYEGIVEFIANIQQTKADTRAVWSEVLTILIGLIFTNGEINETARNLFYEVLENQEHKQHTSKSTNLSPYNKIAWIDAGCPHEILEHIIGALHSKSYNIFVKNGYGENAFDALIEKKRDDTMKTIVLYMYKESGINYDFEANKKVVIKQTQTDKRTGKKTMKTVSMNQFLKGTGYNLPAEITEEVLPKINSDVKKFGYEVSITNIKKLVVAVRHGRTNKILSNADFDKMVSNLFSLNCTDSSNLSQIATKLVKGGFSVKVEEKKGDCFSQFCVDSGLINKNTFVPMSMEEYQFRYNLLATISEKEVGHIARECTNKLNGNDDERIDQLRMIFNQHQGVFIDVLTDSMLQRRIDNVPVNVSIQLINIVQAIYKVVENSDNPEPLKLKSLQLYFQMNAKYTSSDAFWKNFIEVLQNKAVSELTKLQFDKDYVPVFDPAWEVFSSALGFIHAITKNNNFLLTLDSFNNMGLSDLEIDNKIRFMTRYYVALTSQKVQGNNMNQLSDDVRTYVSELYLQSKAENDLKLENKDRCLLLDILDINVTRDERWKDSDIEAWIGVNAVDDCYLSSEEICPANEMEEIEDTVKDKFAKVCNQKSDRKVKFVADFILALIENFGEAKNLEKLKKIVHLFPEEMKPIAPEAIKIIEEEYLDDMILDVPNAAKTLATIQAMLC